MIVKSYQINDALQLTPIDAEEVAETSQMTDARIWLDLHAFEPSELEAWLDKLGVKDLSRRLCIEARDRPGFYPLKKEIFLVIPVLAGTEVQREVDYLAFLCKENLLLTLRSKSILSFSSQHLDTLQESEAWLPERSIAGLVSAVMIELSLVCLRHTRNLRSSILALEKRMDREPDTVEAEEILDLRSELLAHEAVVSDQLPCLRALSRTDKPFFKLKDAQEYMNCALANLQAADQSLDRQDQRIGALRSGFQMYAQDKTNRRLNMLTILSAIFMPITLLAGIWGMNFETMPELKYPFSYPIALGLMALIGSGMYLFFRRKGWLD
jgi:magnesium transporter